MAQARQEPAAAAEADSKVLDLFDRHHRRLYVLARRLAATPDDARDLVQETFVRLARAPRSAPAESSSAAEAWLVRILINICRDEWRLKAKRRRLEAQFLSTSGWTAAPTDSETALIAHTTVWRALEQLAPRRRAVIVLHELEGVGVAQIGRLLGVLPVTVRWHLSRGRRELSRVITHSRENDHERHSIDASRR
jgi:RNA polymerase sigma-70 factor (ECF subfamily)